MATVSAKVFKHHQKADGTFNVKICLYHKSVRKYMDTSHFVSERQLNKRYKINDKFINNLVEKTLQEYRETISELDSKVGFFSCEKLVDYLEQKHHDIDFIHKGTHGPVDKGEPRALFPMLQNGKK